MRHYQENVFRIAPEEAKALLLQDNTQTVIQPMYLGVIVSRKRFYQRKYLDEFMVDIELEEDTRGQRTLTNTKTYNIKSVIYNFASAWKYVKMTTLSKSWKKLMLDENPYLDFGGF